MVQWRPAHGARFPLLIPPRAHARARLGIQRRAVSGKNAEAFARGKIADFRSVGFRAPDDFTLEITLERPTAYFLTVLRANVCFPVHAASVERGGARFDDRTARWTRGAPLVSNGPFRFREWKDHQHIVVEKIRIIGTPRTFASTKSIFTRVNPRRARNSLSAPANSTRRGTFRSRRSTLTKRRARPLARRALHRELFFPF